MIKRYSSCGLLLILFCGWHFVIANDEAAIKRIVLLLIEGDKDAVIANTLALHFKKSAKIKIIDIKDEIKKQTAVPLAEGTINAVKKALEAKETIDIKTAIQLSQAVNAEAAILGSLETKDETYKLQIKLLDVKSGQPKISEQLEFSAKDINFHLYQLAQRLYYKLFNNWLAELELIDKTKIEPAVYEKWQKIEPQVAPIKNNKINLTCDRQAYGTYRAGDKLAIAFSVKDTDSFVTIYGIDPKGRVFMLLPNKSEQNQFVFANKTYTIPAERTKWSLEIPKDAFGVYYVVAIATALPAELVENQDDKLLKEQQQLPQILDSPKRLLGSLAHKLITTGEFTAQEWSAAVLKFYIAPKENKEER